MRKTLFEFVVISLTLVFFLIAPLGCGNNPSGISTFSSRDTVGNAPVIVSVQNVFTYAIDAKTYTESDTIDFNFSTDRITCSLASANFSLGSVTIVISNSTDSVVFSDSVLANKSTVVSVSRKGIPTRCILACTTYTGTLSFVVVGDTSGGANL